MLLALLQILFVTIFTGFCQNVSVQNAGRSSTDCKWLEEIRNMLQVKLHNELKCDLNSDCTGLVSCHGTHMQQDFNFDVNINPCETPIRLFGTINSPKHNVAYSLHDGDHFKLPEEITNPVLCFFKQPCDPVFLYLTLTEPRNRVSSVGLRLTHGSDALFSTANMSIALPACKNGKHVPYKESNAPGKDNGKLHSIIMAGSGTPPLNLCSSSMKCGENEICVNTTDSIKQCQCQPGMKRNSSNYCTEDQNTTRTCDITKMSSCRENEICKQFNHSSSMGYCFCLEEFHLVDGHCVTGSADGEKSKTSVTVTLAVAIPVLVLIICSGFVLLMIKFQVIGRIQKYRRGVRSYEVVDIGNDDDEPLVN